MKKTIFATVLCAIFIVFGLQGCSKAVNSARLENNHWVLRSMNGTNAQSLFEGPIPSLEFNFQDSVISGNSGCNRYFGKFTLNNNKFSAPNMAGTLMACFFANQEDEFLKILSSDNLRIDLDRDTILIFKKDNSEVLRFAAGMPNDREKNLTASNAGGMPVIVPMNNRTKDDDSSKKATKSLLKGEWELRAIDNEDMVVLFNERYPTMEFNDEGNVFGNAGCNNFRSSYTMNDNVITFSPAVTTRMACPYMDGETKFVNTLSKPLEGYLTADNSVLMLFDKDDLVLELVRK